MSRLVCGVLVCASLAIATVQGQPAGQTTAAPPDAIRYTLRFPSPQTHYVEVEATYPTGGQPQVELFMAVWTPGSYLVREYERNVENVMPRGAGAGTTIVKSAKNRWRVTTGGARTVTISYLVYGREMSVRTNWIDENFAVLNGAATFISMVGGNARPHDVRVELPAAWKGSATALTPASAPNTFHAEDYDTLVDSPIVLGNPVVKPFTVAGKRHNLVVGGDPTFFDADRAAGDVQKIVEAAGTTMGGKFDYPHYDFLNIVNDIGGGGLEHKNSFLVMTPRFTTRTPRGYAEWLSLVAHEYFHNWNVKRLRPIELGPFDYENEVHTKGLWVAEGFTDYYADLLVKRAGLSSREGYLDALSDQIESVQTTPGRLVTAVDMASYDAWIKYYRADENTINMSINYYPKGAVIAFLLDARIRRASGGKQSLDDGMRLAYTRYSGAKGYTMEQFYTTMGEAAGTNLRSFFAKSAESTEELDYRDALEWFGLRFRPVDPRAQRAYLGAGTRNDQGRLVVTSVRRDTPALAGGLSPEDEILAIDDVRVRADGLAARLEQYRPGDKIVMLVSRRDRLTKVDVTLGTEPGRAWRLEVNPDATDAQKAQLNAWLGR